MDNAFAQASNIPIIELQHLGAIELVDEHDFSTFAPLGLWYVVYSWDPCLVSNLVLKSY